MSSRHSSTELLGVIGRAGDLPSLPQVVNHILDVMDDMRSSTRDVARALEEDPVLTAKVLRFANSAYYAPRTEITSVSYAIARIGMSEVRNIVVTTGVVSSMHGRAEANLSYEEFWRHCLGVAISAKIVGDRSPNTPKSAKKGENPYFLAGLLHDIGILVFDQYLRTVYSDVLRHVADTDETLVMVENAVLGTNHQAAGALICERWHLPAMVGTTARYHHAPLEAPEDDRLFVSVVHVADALCGQGSASLFHGHDVNATSDVIGLLGLTPDDLSLIRSDVATALEHSDTLRMILQGG